ncbi:glutaredoxin family protein [Alkalibacillus haloalkaliphilus]|uniref:glutaredoxin family protein n=1 Tax=Alkalibacillus haloalkaliphilus TaxID=94136 RepID=UPI002935D5C3|nr:glutaredoxin family protein [Alkalibacillus haloalkaliphilus]MDV2582028.1 glutaredoxin family protein [Alkalibacillus haloalkaliphilus]
MSYNKPIVYFYTKNNCKLCEDVKQLLQILQMDYQFTIVEQNIYKNDTLLEKYFLHIPVVKAGDMEISAEEISFATLEQFLQEHLT